VPNLPRPATTRFAYLAIVAQLNAVQSQISGLDKRITQAHRGHADSKRLDAIPGFGVILSTAVVATMTDPKAFKTGSLTARFWLRDNTKRRSADGPIQLSAQCSHT